MKKLLYLLMILPCLAFSQVHVIEFNANWNEANSVKWLDELTDCKTKKIDIATDTDAAAKYEIVVVPTIVIFQDGEEIKRYQADISFAMKATKEEVQEAVDEAAGSSF